MSFLMPWTGLTAGQLALRQNATQIGHEQFQGCGIPLDPIIHLADARYRGILEVQARKAKEHHVSCNLPSQTDLANWHISTLHRPSSARTERRHVHMHHVDLTYTLWLDHAAT